VPMPLSPSAPHSVSQRSKKPERLGVVLRVQFSVVQTVCSTVTVAAVMKVIQVLQEQNNGLNDINFAYSQGLKWAGLHHVRDPSLFDLPGLIGINFCSADRFDPHF